MQQRQVFSYGLQAAPSPSNSSRTASKRPGPITIPSFRVYRHIRSTWPASRSHYAWGGHFVTRIPPSGRSSRWSQKRIFQPTIGRQQAKPVYPPRSGRRPRRAPLYLKNRPIRPPVKSFPLFNSVAASTGSGVFLIWYTVVRQPYPQCRSRRSVSPGIPDARLDLST